MAGGKETPRQKMVGLMYLVLLALLALQVGSEIMVKFQQLNDSMQFLVKESQGKSQGILANIGAKVKERGSRPKEVKALNQANALNAQTTALISKIQSYKDELIELTGGYNLDDAGEKISYKGMKDSDNTSMLMVGIGDDHHQYKDAKQKTTDGKGYAWSLQKDLNTFMGVLNKAYVDVDIATGGKGTDKVHFGDKLALNGDEDPLFMKTENKKKTWPMLNFDHTPMIASLAFLTEKQSKLAQFEGEILAKLKGVVGAADFKVEKLDVMANADASTVAAGTKYKARIFLTADFGDKMKPEISVGGRKLAVVGGAAEYSFTANTAGAKPNKNGLYVKSYTAKIEVPDPLTGKMKPHIKKVEYFVSKPVIQVINGGKPKLYKDCGNFLEINVPALGALYSPSFNVSGASLIKGKGKGSIVVVPTKASVALTVNSGGNRIGVEHFQVVLVPKPSIVATSRGRAINPKGVKAPGPRSIKMVAKAEPGFAKALPKDSKYSVRGWTATLVRGKRPMGTKKFSKPDGNLSSFAAKAKNGDRIMIEVKKVYRRTYTGKNVAVRIPMTIINVPLTD